MQVQYDNDTILHGTDRNLTVSEIGINGKPVLPDDHNVTYDKGALDGRDVVDGRADLWWNGTLVVDADRSYFPGNPVTLPTAPDTDPPADGSAPGAPMCGRPLRCKGKVAWSAIWSGAVMCPASNDAAHRTAGHDEIRGSGPNQTSAFRTH